MDRQQSPSRRIEKEVTSWPGVTAGMGSRGELFFKVDAREIGHLHGDSVAHFFFDKPRWKALRSAGRIAYHPVFPGKIGPAARGIFGEEDIDDIIDLMRINYEAGSRRRGRQSKAMEGQQEAGVSGKPAL